MDEHIDAIAGKYLKVGRGCSGRGMSGIQAEDGSVVAMNKRTDGMGWKPT
jgi:hypothetical protein